MNYTRIYKEIIDRAVKESSDRKHRKDSGEYFEMHHIKPRCLGGLNTKENLVILTAREHFLAHWLLYRIYPDSTKLAHAFWQMCSWKRSYQKRITPNSRVYQEAKEAIASITSKRFKGCKVPEERKLRISKSLQGKLRPEEVKQKISNTQKGREGTHKGWVTVTNGIEEKRIKSLDECPVGWTRGRKNSARKLISSKHTGKVLSETTKKKISAATKQYRSEHDIWNKGLTYKIK